MRAESTGGSTRPTGHRIHLAEEGSSKGRPSAIFILPPVGGDWAASVEEAPKGCGAPVALTSGSA